MRLLPLVLALCFGATVTLHAAEPSQLAEQLKKLDPKVLEVENPNELLGRYLSTGLRAANAQSSVKWSQIKTKEDWEAFRQEKLAKLRASLNLPQERTPVKIHLAGEVVGDGYRMQRVIFATRPQWYVTANLYLPAKTPAKMPGFLLSHSHHSPKTQGELQDMGMTWARAGCAVLVPDHLGHGERREHPFATAADYDGEYAVSRQDYYFRYDNSLELYLAGESLMGWMVHDLMGDVDVLLAQENIDRQQIILLGGVAGGGDPAAVCGAVDERITCVGPYNFGGPQPETRYPLPDDAETSFGYAGSGSWESTRNLANSASDGFLPWVIVGSVAPRYLIYGHEFAWDGERDPVWKRFEKIWNFYDANDHKVAAHGRGTLRGNLPTDSHCGNIGAFHRRMIHPALNEWFAIESSAEKEYSQRLTNSDLLCWTPELKAQLKPAPLHQILAQQNHGEREIGREALQAAWRKLLKLDAGAFDAGESPQARDWKDGDLRGVKLEFAGDVPTAAHLILPADSKGKVPVVVAIAQGGQQHFLQQRADEVAALLAANIGICLVDVRGTGETSPGRDGGQYSGRTSYSASQLMLGRPLAAGQLEDLQRVVRYLREHQEIDGSHIALWADSAAKPLAADAPFKYPRRIDRPGEAEPGAATLALVAALLDDKLAGVYTSGGLVSFASVLDSPFVQVPHDAIIPGVLFAQADLPAVAKAIAAPVQLAAQVDGRNRLAGGVKESPAASVWLQSVLSKQSK